MEKLPTVTNSSSRDSSGASTRHTIEEIE